MNSKGVYHSVTLEKDKCKGCTTCIKHCPTEAIRVRNGKANIIDERCIDCGQCIRVCPNRAKKVVCSSFDELKNFEYTIALPAPSLYGQFQNLDDVNIILNGLLAIGFDDVFEVSRAAEVVSDFTRKLMNERKLGFPVISSACPAVVRLICMRFPDLVDNIMPILAPVELAAIEAKRIAGEKTGLPPEKIGAFFITPCPAKMTAAASPFGLNQPVIDGAFSMSEVYIKLVGAMKNSDDLKPLTSSGIIGIGWAATGGESAAVLNDKHVAVDGIDNVIAVLSDIEDEKLTDLEFAEMNACTQGCVGGCLVVENPFVARTKIRRLMKYLPVSRNKFNSAPKLSENDMYWENKLSYQPVWLLDNDRGAAMEKMAAIERLTKEFPGLDCGSCGAPSCRSLAEDVVLGFGKEDDCIFRMRERMQYMAGTGDADDYLPPPFRKYESE